MRLWKQIFALVLFACCASSLRADLLLWEVNDVDVEFVYGNGVTETSTLGAIREAADYDGALDYVRVAATAADGTVSYLTCQYYNASGEPTFGPPSVDAGEIDEYHAAGPTWSNLADYTDGTYTFAIELGNFYGDEENEVWYAAARSESATYQDLVTKGYVTPGELAMPGYLPWTGGRMTSVPEPSGGLLFLVGGSLLALRRRRRRA